MGCAISKGSLKQAGPVFGAFKERSADRKEQGAILDRGSLMGSISRKWDMPFSFLAVGGGTFYINSAVYPR